MAEVVGVVEKEGGDAEAGLDLEDGEEGGVALAHRLQALDRLPHLSPLLVVVRQPPQPLRHRLHRRPSPEYSTSVAAAAAVAVVFLAGRGPLPVYRSSSWSRRWDSLLVVLDIDMLCVKMKVILGSSNSDESVESSRVHSYFAHVHPIQKS